jgi:hypothetical protein
LREPFIMAAIEVSDLDSVVPGSGI